MLLFPPEAPGVYAFCPVLTQLEVTGQLRCIAGHTILPKGGACTRKRWEGREEQRGGVRCGSMDGEQNEHDVVRRANRRWRSEI